MSADRHALFFSLSEVAELLAATPDEVVELVHEGALRGTRLGVPAAWRIERDSVSDYLADENEKSRRHALWHESNIASMPEIWGPRVTLPPGS